jgi:hypothetical protein
VCSQAGYAVLLGKGDGTLSTAIFPEPSPTVSNPDPVATCRVIAVADFNNDGASDLLLEGLTEDSLLLSNGHGTFTPQIQAVPGIVKAVADMNGDGKLDLVDSDGVSVVLGNGDGTFASQTTSFQPTWISPSVWLNLNDESIPPTNDAVFAVDDFAGTGRPGIAMIMQNLPGGELSLPNPLPAPASDFLFSATIPVVVAPAGQTTIVVKSKPIGGFNSDVALSCGGLPASVTCSFTPTTLTGGTGQATLTIAASSSAAVGSYPLIVSGTAAGVTHDQQRAVTIATSAGGTNADLRPVAINFSTQMVGGIAAEQVATLANAGGAVLQISGVSISGTNADDFSISSNSCGTSVAAYASCPIVVAFSPKATGPRSATLAISDNATGGVQVVKLTGIGQDFVVGAVSGASSATVAAGKAATYSLSVGGNGGLSGTVSLTCSGSPTAATCAVSPTSVTLNGSGPATATVTVTTTARSEVMTPVATPEHLQMHWIYGSPRLLAIYAVGSAMAFGLMLIFGTRPRRRISWAWIITGVLLIVGLASCGCGGGSSGSDGSNPSGGSVIGTPAGSYTITVTAKTGSGGNAVSHTTNLTLVVQ